MPTDATSGRVRYTVFISLAILEYCTVLSVILRICDVAANRNFGDVTCSNGMLVRSKNEVNDIGAQNFLPIVLIRIKQVYCQSAVAPVVNNWKMC